MQSKINLYVIIPYFKENNIISLLKPKLELLHNLPPKIKTFLILIDDSKQNPIDISQLKDTYSNISCYLMPSFANQGKGAAISTAINFIKKHRTQNSTPTSYVLYTDIDNNINTTTIQTLLNTIIKTKVDITYANKFLKNSRDNRNIFRRTQSKILKLAVKTVFNLTIKDTQTGAKIYKLDSLLKIEQYKKLKTPGFLFEIENAIIAQQLKLKTVAIPVIINGAPPTLNTTKSNLGRGIKALIEFINLVLVYKFKWPITRANKFRSTTK